MGRVLVLQLSRLGDVIQSTPLLMEWMACRPEDHVEALVQEQNRPVLDGLPGLHRVREVPGGGAYSAYSTELEADLQAQRVPQRARELFQRLELPRYDTVLNLTYDLFSGWFASQLSCDHLNGGFINQQGEHLFAGASHVYFAARHAFRDLNWFNLVDLWRAAAPGASVPTAATRPYVSVAGDVPFPLPTGRTVALNPGSGSQERRWPPAHFARLADYMRAAGVTPILVGAPDDQAACTEVVALSSVTLQNYCGQTSIPQLARLLSEVCLLVSVDTGSVHVASAVGTPVVGLYGAAASFRETAPWGEGHVILQTPLGTPLSQLPPDLVFAACRYRLGMLDRHGFREQFTTGDATAWETTFLPPGSDPLGGLSYHALRGHRPTVGDLFSRALRQVFAREFRQSDDPDSLIYLREWADAMDPAPTASDSASELTELRETVASAAALFESMARDAAEGERLVRSVTPRTSSRLSKLGDALVASLEALKTQVEQARWSHLAPVVHYLDWSFRMMPRLPPVETFRFHQKKYGWAASALRRATTATEEISRAGAP